MARALVTSMLFALLAIATPASAQDDAAVSAPRVRVVRPPEGSMRRGVLPAPEWALYACSGALVLVAAGVLAWRSLSRRR